MSDEEDRRTVFIGADRQPHFGYDAELLLQQENDARWLEPGAGVLQVPAERWKQAQAYERGTWMEDAAHALEDRNDEHAVGFGSYAALRGRVFPQAIELGCGPFTNLRVIARSCQVERATLLDPLLASYKQHRNCTYGDGWLRVRETARSRRWGSTPHGRVARKLLRRVAPDFFVERIRVVEELPVPIEAMPERPPYDLVVLINVLEHCYDARKIFAQIDRLTHPGSLFVFHDKLYDATRVADRVASRFDAGHPLRIDEQVLRKELLAPFRPLHEATGRHVEHFHGVDLTERLLYFVGERV